MWLSRAGIYHSLGVLVSPWEYSYVLENAPKVMETLKSMLLNLINVKSSHISLSDLGVVGRTLKALRVSRISSEFKHGGTRSVPYST